MNEKQQIEEMAREMCHLSAECKTCQICNERYHGDDDLCYFQCVAKEIINHDYRKQSEVVRCKDCENFYQDGNIKLCRHWNCHSTEDDAYCSYAKMKGGAKK